MRKDPRHPSTQNRLPRVAIYLRRSEEETGRNFSIETQERACRERADRLCASFASVSTTRALTKVLKQWVKNVRQ